MSVNKDYKKWGKDFPYISSKIMENNGNIPSNKDLRLININNSFNLFFICGFVLMIVDIFKLYEYIPWLTWNFTSLVGLLIITVVINHYIMKKRNLQKLKNQYIYAKTEVDKIKQLLKENNIELESQLRKYEPLKAFYANSRNESKICSEGEIHKQEIPEEDFFYVFITDDKNKMKLNLHRIYDEFRHNGSQKSRKNTSKTPYQSNRMFTKIFNNIDNSEFEKIESESNHGDDDNERI